jgi:hypothetical protein
MLKYLLQSLPFQMMNYNNDNNGTYQALNSPRVPGLVRCVYQRIDGSSDAERIQDIGEVRHGISIELKT